MQTDKNKNIAALLAFFGGIVGLQRFYLGQKGLGFLMIFFAIFTFGIVSSIVGVIDAIIFLTMSDEKFDYKYNNPDEYRRYQTRRPRYKSYERRSTSRGSTNNRPRKDRRITRDEYTQRKDGPKRNRDGPYRRKSSKRRPPKTTRRRKVAVKKIEQFKARGIKKFKDFDIEGSIQEFKYILEIDPNNVAANFNLACAYSQLEKPNKAMKHISRAVKSGFDDFDRIRKHGKLAYARIQPEWEDFEANGFIFDVDEDVVSRETIDDRLVNKKEEESQPEHITEEEKEDLLDHLNTLKEQREKGIISETEFELERRKLMSS